jgi:hypothetical protein
MKALKIKVLTANNELMFKVVAHHFDATQHITIITTSLNGKESDKIRLTAEIHHWNIIDGMVTIYYTSGSYMEITRINA